MYVMDKTNKLDLLVSLYVLCIAVSELMGAKTFPIYHRPGFVLNASVAILVVPVVFLITDIVTEVFGRQRARSIVRSGLLVVFLILVFSLIATQLPPSDQFQSSNPAYVAVFHKTARISAASLVAFGFSELLDIAVFSAIRTRLGKKALWLRTNVANMLGQLVDSTTFIFLAFYMPGQSWEGNAVFLVGLIVPYWLLRCGFAVLETPFVYLGVRWLRKGGEAA